jgi:hypothetical protein
MYLAIKAFKKYQNLREQLNSSTIEGLNGGKDAKNWIEASAGVALAVLVLSIAIWIWALVVVIQFWKLMPDWGKVVGVIGLFFLPPASIVVAYVARKGGAGKKRSKKKSSFKYR